jgi:hypothetical protein
MCLHRICTSLPLHIRRDFVVRYSASRVSGLIVRVDDTLSEQIAQLAAVSGAPAYIPG